MKQIVVVEKNINEEVLDAKLRQSFSQQFIGVSTRSDTVIVHVTDDLTDEAEVRRIVAEHDGSQLSARQLKRQQRQAAIENARLEETDTLALADFSSADPLVRSLARKIRWLELELRELRGLD